MYTEVVLALFILNFFMSLVQVSLIRIYNQLNLTGGSFNFWKEPLACCLETTEAPEATALAFSAFWQL